MTMQPTPGDQRRAHAQPGEGSPVRPGAVATTRLRVRYHECDPMGVAHHASYAPWLEMGRTDLLRDSGVSYAQLEREGVFLVIAKLEVVYKRPVRYDDVVDIHTTWRGGGKVKIEHSYEVWAIERSSHTVGAVRGRRAAPADDSTRAVPPVPELCATARTLLACVDHEGRLRALPEWLAT